MFSRTLLVRGLSSPRTGPLGMGINEDILIKTMSLINFSLCIYISFAVVWVKSNMSTV